MTTLKSLAILLVGIALGFVGGLAVRHLVTHDRVQLNTPYQAVLLDNGQVYYGKLQGPETPFPILTDVYYIQNRVDPQTKAVSNVLVRRGKEWHAPDRMILNARHVVLIEPVGPGSQVAKFIEEFNKNN
ncbi:MAG TPA: hypothetical protein VNM68_07475 [Candidatus Polarisedimenticolia bacterium]|nr:hypothetical protein [Candidatus Polarisedimenticolia bacterium]